MLVDDDYENEQDSTNIDEDNVFADEDYEVDYANLDEDNAFRDTE